MSVFAAQQDRMLHDGSTVAAPMPSTAKPVTNQPQTEATAATGSKTGEKRVTVYDPDDAYGGI
ncbi:hypothetical protein AGABI2DRAFT_136620 [Agaricus bisporus var. bisporus H97]|uniref:hypothetical protein n=1 Tax=Agaricus bisporus var. bisporus (strain H97 / ATCC MYA-4626 / FGSC 10389) TaxID=936046 RepID=UPI00029F586F|nr:hypothetical protein AGABI2DRAFT_136620 [Agaricus bisporus var. bisporus H97]EKV46370.1 hypothetical protein AGABI2DRAFT_136620 [Agaricus bisporus var. bisporus H97]